MPDIFSIFGGAPAPKKTNTRPVTRIPAKQFLAQYMASPMYKKRLSNFNIKQNPNVQDFLNTHISSGGWSKTGMGSHALTKAELPPPTASKQVAQQYKDSGYKYGVNNIYVDNDQINAHNSANKFEAGFSSTTKELPSFLTKNALGNMYPENLLAHELSHVSRELSPEEQQFVAGLNYNKDNVKSLNYYNKVKQKNSVSYNDYMYGKGMHDDVPGELKADLDSFRYQLYKHKIYDASKGDLKLEHIQKALTTPGLNVDFQFQRLLKHFYLEGLVDFNNKVAGNTNINQKNTQV